MKRIIACVGLSVGLVLVGISLTFARANVSQASTDSSFQVTTRIFAGGDRSPVAEHLVLFDLGVVYSLPENTDEPVAIINTVEDHVILLHRTTGIHTAISTTDLLNMTASLRASATSDDLVDRLGINAKVESDPSGNYSTAYGGIQYQTTTQQPADSQWAQQFGEFADWAARINIAQKRGLPPFGRMLMNAQIAADGRIPRETKLQYQLGDVTQHYRSTHEVADQIGETARVQINQVRNMLQLGKRVPLSEFP